MGSSTERFDDRLTLGTLQDGTSNFTFTTFLNVASPRDPRTLKTSDECGWRFLSRFPQSESLLDLVQHYTEFSSCSGQGSDLAIVCSFGTSSNTERWIMIDGGIRISKRKVVPSYGYGWAKRNNDTSQLISLTIGFKTFASCLCLPLVESGSSHSAAEWGIDRLGEKNINIAQRHH